MHLYVWRCKHLPPRSVFTFLTWQYILSSLLLMLLRTKSEAFEAYESVIDWAKVGISTGIAGIVRSLTRLLGQPMPHWQCCPVTDSHSCVFTSSVAC
jgi:hypothetical protein